LTDDQGHRGECAEDGPWQLVGVWRPSQTATDVTAELAAMQRADAKLSSHIFPLRWGLPLPAGRGTGDPAAFCGINVEATKDGFLAATQGKGNYAKCQ